jgi:mono/diheme cytochrome c family protein
MSERLILPLAVLIVTAICADVARTDEQPVTVELPPPVAEKVDFARDVQPIFVQHCQTCHGPDKSEGGLRLHRRDDALSGGDSGKEIEPGKSADSRLIQLVSGADPDRLMPPEGERLTAKEISILRAWIDQGAQWPFESDSKTSKGASHWSFQPIKPHTPPTVQNTAWVRNSIDAFVLARLEAEGIQPSPEADRTTLIRRLSLDLLGLPPAPADVAEFVADTRPDAYEKLVDKLLASPHFGERWGRHWLDLARYADSDGFDNDDFRPNAWRYRDWVVEALNRDLPFDQFTIEQLAGDLLPNANFTQKLATGFHRNTPHTTESGVDQQEFRALTLADRVNTTGAIWLGLTVACAQCHSHKYDPLTQREYFSLYSFFNNADDTPLEISEGIKAQVLTQSSTPRGTYVHMRGDYRNRGPDVQPGTPAVLPPLSSPGTAAVIPTRLDLAHWLVDPANPLTARVTANRWWSYLFGKGLVATIDDFGTQGTLPSHPELLDWLAAEAIRLGWSQKQMIRLVVGSATYRQSSAVRLDLTERDPENRLLARQNAFRLEGEIIRDVTLAASGLLNTTIGGPAFFPKLPPEATQHVKGWTTSDGPALYRRSLYIAVKRGLQYPMLTIFDAPDPHLMCAKRERSNTPTQALMALNDELFFASAQAFAGRILQEGSGSTADLLRLGYRICMAREPNPEELACLEQLHQKQLELLQADPDAAQAMAGNLAKSTGMKAAPAAAWVGVSRVLLNLDEFLNRE